LSPFGDFKDETFQTAGHEFRFTTANENDMARQHFADVRGLTIFSSNKMKYLPLLVLVIPGASGPELSASIYTRAFSCDNLSPQYTSNPYIGFLINLCVS
jgi:hypothetical protein